MRIIRPASGTILFWVRISLGFVFLLSGLAKVRQPYDFLANVYAYQMTGTLLTRWIAMLLPWVELIVGLSLLGGVLVGGALGVMVLMAVIFAYAQGTAIASGLAISCGCFESLWATDSINYTSLARSGGILAAAVAGIIAWRRGVPGRASAVCLLGVLVCVAHAPAGAQTPDTVVTPRPATRIAAARNPAPVDRPAALPASPRTIKKSLPHAIAPAVASWLDDWQAGQLRGDGASPVEVRRLISILDDTNAPAIARAQLGGLIGAMDGDEISKPLCIAAVDRGVAELAGAPAGAASARPLVGALWGVHEVLWRLEEYATDLRLVACLRPWETRGSAHSQWANFIHAELLLLNDRDTEAFRAFQDCVAEREMATEPSLGINRALDWELAISAFNAGDYSEALVHYEKAAGHRGTAEAEAASASVCVTLAALGREEEAVARMSEHVASYKTSPAATTELDRRIREASLRSRPLTTTGDSRGRVGGTR